MVSYFITDDTSVVPIGFLVTSRFTCSCLPKSLRNGWMALKAGTPPVQYEHNNFELFVAAKSFRYLFAESNVHTEKRASVAARVSKFR